MCPCIHLVASAPQLKSSYLFASPSSPCRNPKEQGTCHLFAFSQTYTTYGSLPRTEGLTNWYSYPNQRYSGHLVPSRSTQRFVRFPLRRSALSQVSFADVVSCSSDPDYPLIAFLPLLQTSAKLAKLRRELIAPPSGSGGGGPGAGFDVARTGVASVGVSAAS